MMDKKPTNKKQKKGPINIAIVVVAWSIIAIFISAATLTMADRVVDFEQRSAECNFMCETRGLEFEGLLKNKCVCTSGPGVLYYLTPGD